MVLIRNVRSANDRDDKLKKILTNLNLQIRINDKLKTQRSQGRETLDIELSKPKIEEVLEGFVLNQEQTELLDDFDKLANIARRNLLKLTDQKNADIIINVITDGQNKKSRILTFNRIFPMIERLLKRDYKNVSVDFFSNFVLSKIKETEEQNIKGEDDDDEGLKEALDKRKQKQDLEVDEAELEKIIQNPEEEDKVDDNEDIAAEFVEENLEIKLQRDIQDKVNRIVNGLTKNPETEKRNILNLYIQTEDKKAMIKFISDLYKEQMNDPETSEKQKQMMTKTIKDILQYIKTESKIQKEKEEEEKTKPKPEQPKPEQPKPKTKLKLNDVKFLYSQLQNADPTKGRPSGIILIEDKNNQGKFYPIGKKMNYKGIYVKKMFNQFYVVNPKNGDELDFTLENLKSIYDIDFITEQKLEEMKNKMNTYNLGKKFRGDKDKISGYGLKKKIVGRGLDEYKIKVVRPYNNKNIYNSFGENFRISKSKLKDNILSVQYNSGHSISIPNTKISNELKDVIEDVIENKFNPKMLKYLNDREKVLFRKLMNTTRILNNDEMEYLDDFDKKMSERFNLLRGIIGSGNDNEQLKEELKNILSYYLTMKQITKKQYNDIIQML